MGVGTPRLRCALIPKRKYSRFMEYCAALSLSQCLSLRTSSRRTSSRRGLKSLTLLLKRSRFATEPEICNCNQSSGYKMLRNTLPSMYGNLYGKTAASSAIFQSRDPVVPPLTTSAVTSAGVYPATRMRYCSGDAHPFLRVQSGSPEVSVTYQKVEQLSCDIHVSVTVLLCATRKIRLISRPLFPLVGARAHAHLP